MSATRKARLGKGLSALLGEYSQPQDAANMADGIRVVPVARITANRFQPRREFQAEQLAELEASIRQNGLLQPLVVRPAPGRRSRGRGVGAGGRRAALAGGAAAGVDRGAGDREGAGRPGHARAGHRGERAARRALPLEEAAGYQQLIDEFGFTQAEVAESVGRERSTVANLLRLLQLPASVQRMVSEGTLSMGHARAILGLEDERAWTELAREAADGLPIRARRGRARPRAPRPGREGEPGTAPVPAPTNDDPHLRHLEAELQRTLGTAVRIRVQGGGKSGRIEVPFYNADDFDRVLELLLGKRDG
jgi:ParB family chromosome partitioning protein